MTMQASDSVFYEEKEFTLIDVEAGKQIIDYANFSLIQPLDEFSVSSACWRGYTAEYFIEDNKLYGIKTLNPFEHKVNKSTKVCIPFTGSCIIACGSGWNSDFISSYVDYDEAYELYFDAGKLVEKLSLISAIDEMKELKDTDKYNNEMEPYDRRQAIEVIARKPLKYHYDDNSYKWRNNRD